MRRRPLVVDAVILLGCFVALMWFVRACTAVAMP